MSRGILELNEITGQIIAAALKVHTVIGPGLLESVYQTCVHHELQKRGFQSQTEVPLPVIYEGLRVDSKFRLDLIVENRVIVEFKCVDALLPIHKAQLLTYLRLANLPLEDGIDWSVFSGLDFDAMAKRRRTRGRRPKLTEC